MKKILLLGSGELGKELVIALKRLGQYVIACDNYHGAPAMQMADEWEVVDMLNGTALDEIVRRHNPDIIVPEVESIRTDRFYDYEKDAVVVPSAKAANYTMNRKLIRDLAAVELGLKTAGYRYATTFEEFKEAVATLGMPCVVKPLMSSSGKGQSVVRDEADMEKSFKYALDGSRGDLKEMIVEEFIDFQSEITLLTLTQNEGPTLFCPPIGHRQERGDYMESWQPCALDPALLEKAKTMAEKVTAALGGAGIWGVEFFIGQSEVWFSELSPRPHDTGMVTLAGTQDLNEFELHARSILSLPVRDISLRRPGVSAVILAEKEKNSQPSYEGSAQALELPCSDLRIFGKPSSRPYRRMGVILHWGASGDNMNDLRKNAAAAAAKVKVH